MALLLLQGAANAAIWGCNGSGTFCRIFVGNGCTWCWDASQHGNDSCDTGGDPGWLTVGQCVYIGG
jgi:hypothetical protein